MCIKKYLISFIIIIMPMLQAHEVFGQNADEYLYYAGQYLQNGKYPEALDILKKGIKSHPDDSRLFFEAGSLCYMMKKYRESNDFFQNALKIDPGLKKRILKINKNFKIQDKADIEDKYAVLVSKIKTGIPDRLYHIRMFKKTNPDWHDNNDLTKLEKQIQLLWDAPNISPEEKTAFLNTNHSLWVASEFNGRIYKFITDRIIGELEKKGDMAKIHRNIGELRSLYPLNPHQKKFTQFFTDFLVSNVEKETNTSNSFLVADKWLHTYQDSIDRQRFKDFRDNLSYQLVQLHYSPHLYKTRYRRPINVETIYRRERELFGDDYIVKDEIVTGGDIVEDITGYHLEGYIKNVSELRLDVELYTDFMTDLFGVLFHGFRKVGNPGSTKDNEYKKIVLRLKPGESEKIDLGGDCYVPVKLKIGKVTKFTD